MRSETRRFALLQTMAVAAFLGVLWTAGFLAYWLWLDPVLPDIRVIDVEVNERVPPDQRGRHNRIFEVQRIIESSGDVDATLLAFFEKPPPAEPLFFEGREVTRDRVVYAISPAHIRIEKGVHQRDRLWEVPALLEPGPYIYRAVVRACNPVRCAETPFPSITVHIQ